jgi:methyltransferase
VVTLWLFTGLLGALALERLFELLLSRRNAARAFAQGAQEYGVGHYRAMTALHTAFLISCAAEPWLFARPFPGALGLAALGGAAVAQGLRYWAIVTLGERWNTRVIVIPGAEPVTAGPYRWLKHPNYVAVVLELLCVPLIHGAWVTALAFSLANAALLTVRIRAEEAALGAAWQRAFAGKGRFVPGGKVG